MFKTLCGISLLMGKVPPQGHANRAETTLIIQEVYTYILQINMHIGLECRWLNHHNNTYHK